MSCERQAVVERQAAGRPVLTHEERIQAARALCDRLAARHPGGIVVAGVYGSTARGDDTLWSDLELLLVVRDGTPLKSRHFGYRDTSLALVSIEQSKLERALTTSVFAWEYWMCLLSELDVLYGDRREVERWLELGRSVPPEKFRQALEESVSWVAVESLARLRSCRARGDGQDIPPAVLDLLSEIRLALCLLNRRWVRHKRYRGLLDTFEFPKLPDGYRELARRLWGTRDADEAVTLAETLVQNFRRLLAAEGIPPPREYASVDDLPL